jgi:hypothetical protein
MVKTGSQNGGKWFQMVKRREFMLALARESPVAPSPQASHPANSARAVHGPMSVSAGMRRRQSR